MAKDGSVEGAVLGSVHVTIHWLNLPFFSQQKPENATYPNGKHSRKFIFSNSDNRFNWNKPDKWKMGDK